jgi:hypothetical protein
MNGPSGREEWDAEMAWFPGGWTDGSGVSYQDYVSYGELGPEERAVWRREQEAAQAEAEAARAAELAEWGATAEPTLNQLIARSAETDPDPVVEAARVRYLDAAADRDDARPGAVWSAEQAAANAWCEYTDAENGRATEPAEPAHDWEAGA